jgi:hypothetical protein
MWNEIGINLTSVNLNWYVLIAQSDKNIDVCDDVAPDCLFIGYRWHFLTDHAMCTWSISRTRFLFIGITHLQTTCFSVYISAYFLAEHGEVVTYQPRFQAIFFFALTNT